MNYAKYLIYLPFLTIFLIGIVIPVGDLPYKPVFQPPNQVFGLVWTYVTISFGYISYIFFNHLLLETARKSLLKYYFIILFLLNFWLVLNSFEKYKYAFWELVISSYIAILYLLFLVKNSKTKESAKYVYFLLPLPFWLILASCLNGVIHDFVSRQ